MGKREKIKFCLLLASDFLALVLTTAAVWLTLGWRYKLILDYGYQENVQFILILLCAFFVTFMAFNRTEAFLNRGPRRELLVCVESNLFLAAVLAVFLLITKARLLESRYMYVGVICGNTVLMYLFRMVLRQFMFKTFSKSSFASLVGVITTCDRAERFVKALNSDWMQKVQGVALIDALPDRKGSMVAGVPVMATYEDCLEWIRRDPLDEVYINIPYDTGDSLLYYVHELESMGLAVHLNVPTLEKLQKDQQTDDWMPRLERVLEETAGVPLVTVAFPERKMRDTILKRAMDIFGSLVGLVISVPIILITAIPLKLESKGPLFFKQQRVGLNGRIFCIYKLRSMYQNADAQKGELMDNNKMQGFMFKMDDDPRITRVGRFIRRTSIDELPQFWNVLKGDMSLVGTRPPTVDEYNQYQSHHKRRLSMKPGITGMWQVSGRSNIQNFEEVVKLDVTYIDNWSLALDMKILFKTIAIVFSGRGAE